jgi:hypothetical protein
MSLTDETALTVYLDGQARIGPYNNILLLPVKYRPIVHTGSDLVTMTEDGSALNVGVGYDASANVILVGQNVNQRCELVKPLSHWSLGYQNVVVTVPKAGYAAGSIPSDIEQLATEIALLIFRSPSWIGKASKSTRGGSLTYAKDLTPQSVEVLADMIERAV